ncbi:MAG: DinB family protein [Gemmatimonadaceae bacterium]
MNVFSRCKHIMPLVLALGVTAEAQVAPRAPGFRAEFLAELSVAEDHVVRLAEAIPADKYTWRPASGVRSISEVLLHIASSHFNIPRVLGVAPSEGMKTSDYERSTTDKTLVVAALKESFAFTRVGVERLTDADAEKSIPWFDGRNTYRGILYFMARHTGEHTGQLIAYARMIGVVPPWSER